MKKSAIILAFSAAFCALSGFTAYAQPSEFTVKDGMIAAYNGTDSSVEIPAVIDGVEIAGIDSYAFSNNDTVETVVIGDGIEVIQSHAFENCGRLTSVECPDSMLLICFDAFYGCYSLDDLIVPETTDMLIDYSASFMSEDEAEYSVSDSTITRYNGAGGDVVIPQEINGVTITAVGASAFEGNTTITSVMIPDTITSIGGSAFKGCTALSSVKLPAQLSSTGSSVCRGCTSLETVAIPGSLKTIGSYMFYGCSGLKSVVMEEGVLNTGAYTFYECTNLETVTVPSTLNVVETWAMGFCKKLKTFYLPEGMKSLGSASFYYCNALNNIDMPNTVTSVGTHCFRACFALDSIKLSSNLKLINYRVFDSCAFDGINIPVEVKSIEAEAFWNCNKLASINIPPNVTSIGDRAFNKCNKLASINIPPNVTSIGDEAFNNCTALKSAVMYDKVTAIGTNLFGLPNGSMNNNATIYAPESSYAERYAKDNGIDWKPIVTLNAPIVGSGSIGAYGTINYPFTARISSFGMKYLPEILYNAGSEDTLDIKYGENITVENGNTYMTLMTGVPDEAMKWTYAATPYIILNDGTTIIGNTRSFAIADTIINTEGGTVTNVD